MKGRTCLLLAAAAAAALFGCARNQQRTPLTPADARNGANGDYRPGQGVYSWQDIPPGQQITISRASFDVGGYQLYSATGATIVVPFVAHNLGVLKFGRSTNAQTYLMRDSGDPVLYLAPGASLDNTSIVGSKWEPIPSEFEYNGPIYVTLAPDWNQWVTMDWFPGMSIRGGYWGHTPATAIAAMPMFSIAVDEDHLHDLASLQKYAADHPGSQRSRAVFDYAAAHSTAPFWTYGGGGGGIGSMKSLAGGKAGGKSGAADSDKAEGLAGGKKGEPAGSGYTAQRLYGEDWDHDVSHPALEQIKSRDSKTGAASTLQPRSLYGDAHSRQALLDQNRRKGDDQSPDDRDNFGLPHVPDLKEQTLRSPLMDLSHPFGKKPGIATAGKSAAEKESGHVAKEGIMDSIFKSSAQRAREKAALEAQSRQGVLGTIGVGSGASGKTNDPAADLLKPHGTTDGQSGGQKGP